MGVSATGGVQVVDRNGKVLGSIAGVIGYDVLVAVKGDPVVFPVMVINGDLFGFDAVYFDGPGCTGQAYGSPSGGVFPVSAIDNQGRVFAADSHASRARVTVASFGGPGMCSDATMDLDLAPAAQVFDLAAFAPPFSVQ
jgi:hypothetical protein